METNSVLSVTDLQTSYGAKLVLKGINLDVPRGIIFALLGPNGAGKTTFIKSVLDLLAVNSGAISIEGIPHSKTKSREKLSYFPEKFYFYPYYTVRGALEFYATMYGLSKIEFEERLSKITPLVGIQEIIGNQVSKISKGQLQRVGLACCFMSPSDLYILDEPFSGLDPIGIKEIKDVFKTLKEEGKTIFINSHILSEVEKFADIVSIMNEGKILKQGTVEEVRGTFPSLEEAFYNLIKGGV